MKNYTGSSAKNAYLEFGSTSIKLYIVPSASEASEEIERERKVPWSLGYDVFSYGRISPRTMAHCVSTLRSLSPLSVLPLCGRPRTPRSSGVCSRASWD